MNPCELLARRANAGLRPTQRQRAEVITGVPNAPTGDLSCHTNDRITITHRDGPWYYASGPSGGEGWVPWVH